MSIKEEIYESVLNGDAQAVGRLVPQALQEGFSAESLLKETLIPAMGEVGARFEAGDYYVPEMLISGGVGVAVGAGVGVGPGVELGPGVDDGAGVELDVGAGLGLGVEVGVGVPTPGDGVAVGVGFAFCCSCLIQVWKSDCEVTRAGALI